MFFESSLIFFFFLISIFILRTLRKATEALTHLTSNYPRRCQDIAVRLEVLTLFFFSFIEIRLKFRTAFQNYQARESALKCLSQIYNRMKRVGFESEVISLTALKPLDHAADMRVLIV